MATRKTIEVETLRNTINEKIARADSEAQKETLCNVLENILHSTGNYNGFMYNLTNEQWRELEASVPSNESRVDRAITLGWITEFDRTYY